jgi:hypothetical protein
VVFSGYFTAIDKKIEVTNNKIDLNQGNILSVYQNYTQSLSEMNNTVQYQLDTISKMEGPQVIYLTHGEVYSIQHYVMKFVSDLQQIGGFLWFLPPIKLTATLYLKYC